MSNKVATLCTRVGITALASLAVFAVSGGAASAAPGLTNTVAHSISRTSLTPAQCAALLQQIETNNVRIDTLQEMLETAPAPIKGDIIKKIRDLEAQNSTLQAQYDAGCH